MSSKNDFEAMISIINGLIKNLTKTEYENILNGSATFKYVERSLNSTEKNYFDLILSKLVKIYDEQSNPLDYIKGELETKNQQINFCNYLNVDIKTKDSKEEIYNKILLYVEENIDLIKGRIYKSNSIEKQIEEIRINLEACNDIQKAVKYLSNCKILEYKNNLLHLAKILDVNVRKEHHTEDILNRIVESVVGSKLRSMAIRGKYNNK
ncbi:hypothetical protein [Peribacillus loiseleuriae]|uniref:hypothetical protein n=1 Tax=Peribacillus loiseleuriae TaxID=1679170 RepID=UPI003CFFE0E5